MIHGDGGFVCEIHILLIKQIFKNIIRFWLKYYGSVESSQQSLILMLNQSVIVISIISEWLILTHTYTHTHTRCNSMLTELSVESRHREACRLAAALRLCLKAADTLMFDVSQNKMQVFSEETFIFSLLTSITSFMFWSLLWIAPGSVLLHVNDEDAA